MPTKKQKKTKRSTTGVEETTLHFEPKPTINIGRTGKTTLRADYEEYFVKLAKKQGKELKAVYVDPKTGKEVSIEALQALFQDKK